MGTASRVVLALTIAAAITSIPAPAAAEPRVVVLGSGPDTPRTSFVQTLTIQLSGDARVETGPQLAVASLPERLAEAAGILAERDATLGVWIEVAAAVPHTFDVVLYAVGRRRDVALVRVARVEVAEGEDVDRALALKVSGFLDEMLAVEDPELRLVRVIVPAPAPPVSATAERRRRARRVRRAWGERRERVLRYMEVHPGVRLETSTGRSEGQRAR